LSTSYLPFGDEHIIDIFIKSMRLKQEEYDKVLDEQTFLSHDKIRWDAWSNLFAEQTGKPTLEYPFIDRMSGPLDKDEKNKDEKKVPQLDSRRIVSSHERSVPSWLAFLIEI
jgi:hypothetical protein